MTETDKNQGKEQVGQSDKIVQMFFYPQEDPMTSISALPVIIEAAGDFFASSNKPYKNILVIATPSMADINIPHFREWHKRTGKYLEGYLQHTKTGFLRNRPMSKKQLEGVRSNLEVIFSGPDIAYPAEEEISQLSFFGGLLMLDRLAEERDFTLEIEPASGNSIIDQYKKERRLLRKLNQAEINPANYKDSQEWLEALCRADTARLQQTAELVRDSVASFHNFFESIVSRDSIPSKIFVLRDIAFYDVDQLRFQNGNTKDIEYDFLPVQAITGNGGLLEINRVRLFSRFIQDPKAEVTKEEEIQRGVLLKLSNGFQKMELVETFQEYLPTFLKNATAKELEEYFLRLMTNEIGLSELLDFFGQKTDGSKYGFQYEIMANARDYLSNIFSKPRSNIQTSVSEELKGAIEDQKKRQEGKI